MLAEEERKDDEHSEKMFFGKFQMHVSDLIEAFSKNGVKEGISDIITKWKFLEHEKNLTNILFKHECFDEISELIYSVKGISRHFTEDDFELVINKEELDLSLYFLKLPNCRQLLNNKGIQNVIVENYIK